MQNKKSSVLIVGNDSYLSSGLMFDENKYNVDRIFRPFEQKDKAKYKDYNCIINFCIQPWQFTGLIDESEMIDVQIAKEIKDTKTRFVFLSSRKVYGSCTELKEYKETDELKPFDFYAKNKVAIEIKLREILTDNLLILRTGNIIGEPTRQTKNTFIGWLEKELEEKGRVCCTIDPDTRKDFITKAYFQKVLSSVVEKNLSGIYNVGAGFTLPIKEILLNLLPENLLDFTNASNTSEQFVLNCEKLKQADLTFSKEDLIAACSKINTEYFCIKTDSGSN